MAQRLQDPTGGQVQFIEVSEKPATAKVVREGFQVPPVNFDQQKTNFLIDQLVTVTPQLLPRVIGQSVSSGTKVTQGTVIDLVLAPRDSVPFDIFTDVHADLKGKPVTAVDTIVNNANLRKTLLSYDNAADVPPADKQALTDAMKPLNITVNEADATRTFALAYQAVRGAVAFR